MRQSKAAAFHHYLPIDDALFHGALYVTSAGRGCVPAGQPYPPPGHPSLYQFAWNEGRVLPEFSLVYVTAGAGLVETGRGGAHPVPEGSAFLLAPGVWHRYRPNLATGWTERWVQFNGVLAHGLLDQGWFLETCPVIIPLSPALFVKQLDHLLDDVESHPAHNNLSWSLQVVGLLAHLLPTTPAALKPGQGRHADTVVSAALDCIWNHSHRVLGVLEVATYTGVNRRTLERRFQAALGHGILEEIVRCRCNRAERLLRETNLPIKRIVELAGFGSAENMRQVFQQRHRRAPADFRTPR